MAENNTAESKRRQRARQRDLKSILGTNSLFEGRVVQMQKRTFRQVQKDAEHVTDFAGELTDARLLANNTVMVGFQVPIAYMDEVMHMVSDNRGEFTMFRAYRVPKPRFIPLLEQQIAEAAAQAEGEAGDATGS